MHNNKETRLKYYLVFLLLLNIYRDIFKNFLKYDKILHKRKGGIKLEPLKYYEDENALKFYLLDCRFRVNAFNYISK